MSGGRELLKGPGVVPLEKMQEVADGMSESRVLKLLGPPKFKKAPGDVSGPSDIFQQLGSMFSFDVDEDLDSVWVYVHDKRGKFDLTKLVTTFVGFRRSKLLGFGFGSHKVTGSWQESRPFEDS